MDLNDFRIVVTVLTFLRSSASSLGLQRPRARELRSGSAHGAR